VTEYDDRVQELYLSHGEDWWPPHELRLELVEGCTLRCHSCGIRGIRQEGDRRMGRMVPALWRELAQQITHRQWRTRVVLSGRGEPTLHPQIEACVRQVRRAAPSTPIWAETSGAGLVVPGDRDPDLLRISVVNSLYTLFESGLSVMLLSRRAGAEYVWDYVEEHRTEIEDSAEVSIRRGEPTSWKNSAELRDVWLLPDVNRGRGHTPAWSHAGAGARPTWAGRSRCLHPAREMSVRYDGLVQLCSEDWRGEVILGDLREQSLWDVWYSERARAARRRAMAGLRDLRPCSACDALSNMSQNQRNRHMVRQPEPADRGTILGALASPPATPPVLRSWERPTP
jgi:MoaA/NifB/PqqE/SkfB family radical SAM enzyme